MVDVEVEAMAKVADALSELGDEERGRVLRWAADRYGLEGAVAPVRPSKGVGNRVDLVGERNEESDAAIEVESADVGFDHFADLFDAFHPSNDTERALIGGYWFQAIQEQSSFTSAEVNRELRNLGHAIGNVTQALTANITKKPALILQLKKAGSQRQGRKTYKLSNEGLKQVQARIG